MAKILICVLLFPALVFAGEPKISVDTEFNSKYKEDIDLISPTSGIYTYTITTECKVTMDYKETVTTERFKQLLLAEKAKCVGLVQGRVHKQPKAKSGVYPHLKKDKESEL